MDLEQELKAIWDRYAPQRYAEMDALRFQEQARKELAEFNAKRLKVGLPSVSEYREQSFGMAQAVYTIPAPAKTWRDEMDAELLSAVRRRFQQQ